MSDAYHCRWCGRPFVVPDLTTDHENRCELRPRETTGE